MLLPRMVSLASAAGRPIQSLRFPLATVAKRLMSTKTIAVLDQADLKDGQMYVTMSHRSLASASECCKGKKSLLVQDGCFCPVWVTRSMQPVHSAPIMVLRSSKVSSQLTAGSSGENLRPLVVVSQLLTSLACSPWHGGIRSSQKHLSHHTLTLLS